MRVLRLEKGRCCGAAGAGRPGGAAVDGPGTLAGILAFLAERFQFHPLALEDCAHEDQRVKFEQYGDHLFMVVHRMMPAPDDSEIWPRELHAFLTPEALVTVHSTPIAEVDHVFERCAAEPGLLRPRAGLRALPGLRRLADVHFALVDALSAEVEELADEVLARESAVRPGGAARPDHPGPAPAVGAAQAAGAAARGLRHPGAARAPAW